MLCRIKCCMTRALPVLRVVRGYKELQNPCIVSGSICPCSPTLKIGASPLYLRCLIQYHMVHFLYSSRTVPIQFSIPLIIYSRLLGFALRNCMRLNSGMGKGYWNCFGLSQCKCLYSPYRGAFPWRATQLFILLTIFNLLMELT